MKVIREYFLNSEISPQKFYLPKGAQVLSVDNSTGLVLYVLVDPAYSETDLRTFKICTAAETLYYDNIQYIGSFKGVFGNSFVIEIL